MATIIKQLFLASDKKSTLIKSRRKTTPVSLFLLQTGLRQRRDYMMELTEIVVDKCIRHVYFRLPRIVTSMEKDKPDIIKNNIYGWMLRNGRE